MTTEQVLRTIWRRRLYVLLTVLVVTGGAYFVGRLLPDVYSASATLFVGDRDTEEESTTFDALQSQQALAKTYAELIQSRNVAARVAAELAGRLEASEVVRTREPYLLAQGVDREEERNSLFDDLERPRDRGSESGTTTTAAPTRPQADPLPAPPAGASSLDAQEVLGRMTFEPVTDTQLIVITAEGSTARDAALLANTYGAVFEQYAQSFLGPRTGSNVSMVDVARVPVAPIRPRPALYAGVAFVLSLFLGVGMAFARDRFSRRLGDYEELAEAASLPVLARVPALSERRLSNAEKQRFREAFRVLRTNLQLLGGTVDRSCLAVTSASAAEGKSTSVLGLARAIAEQGQVVLVIEADLRRPTLAERLDIAPTAVGLAHCLAVGTDPEQGVHATDVPGLLLMPAGATPPDPSSLLTPAALGDVLSRVRSMADAILLDTPPVSAGADATILANAAGGVLLVANHRRGTRSRVLRSVKALRQTGSEIVGLLVNEVSAADNDAYYDYYARAELPELAPPRDEEASLRSAG